MKTQLIILIALLFSCTSENNEPKLSGNEITNAKIDTIAVIEYRTDTVFVENWNEDEYYVIERLPTWFYQTNLLKGLILKNKYRFDNRLNPMYLEADFNGDEQIDIAIPIEEIQSEKSGFAVIHGGTNELYIIGAGIKYKNGASDDLNWYDIWKVNRNKINPPGVDGTENLILTNPSIQVEKSEVGGGQIFWNGKEYEYFHQTC